MLDMRVGELCCRVDGSDASGNVVCCQCTAQTVRGLEKDSVCEECWAAKVEKQRFDRVAIDAHSKPKQLLIIEVKRVSDMMEDYWQRGVNMAEKQYTDYAKGSRIVFLQNGNADLCQSFWERCPFRRKLLEKL